MFGRNGNREFGKHAVANGINTRGLGWSRTWNRRQADAVTSYDLEAGVMYAKAAEADSFAISWTLAAEARLVGSDFVARDRYATLDEIDLANDLLARGNGFIGGIKRRLGLLP